MTKPQKYLLASALLVIVVLTLFPPWSAFDAYNGHRLDYSDRYAFLLTPPLHATGVRVDIHYGHLGLEYLLVISLECAVLIWLPPKSHKP